MTASDHKAKEEGCFYDPESAERAVSFIERYVNPSTLGKRIVLLPWQRDLVSKLFGWKRQDGRLRFKRVTCSMAKKNGKTVLVAAILAYGLLGNLCPSPFVASASTSRENASQVYRELTFTIRQNPKLLAISKCLDSTKEVRVKTKHARYRAFSADAGSSEGENLSLCVTDEVHAWQGDKLYRSLEYSTVARADGLLVNISTAGHDQSHFWYDIFQYAKGVQNSDIVDTSLLAAIYTVPDDADIDSPDTWRLANPSLGISFNEEDFRRDLERAKQGGTADLLSFKRYRLNQWVRADDSFIDPVKYDKCCAPLAEHELQGKPLFVGCDLSQTTDPSSISCVWALGDRKFYIRNHCWTCEEAVKRRELTNLPKYKVFQAEGSMTITHGTVNDYRKIKAYILDLRARYNLKEVIFDQYNAMEMCAELMANGMTVYRQPQTHRHYTAPCKDLEIAITEQRIKHDGNRLLRWALANTRLDMDSYGNCKPSRDKSTDKIDAAVSTLMAFGRAVEATVTSGARQSVYDSRGIYVL